MYVPEDVLACDHGEQMVPPIRALGSEYVGVMHRPRGSEPAIWRMIGAANGTVLDWSSDVGGPATLDLGEVATFATRDPFVVTSQDEEHPFLLFSHMVGSNYEMSTIPEALRLLRRPDLSRNQSRGRAHQGGGRLRRSAAGLQRRSDGLDSRGRLRVDTRRSGHGQLRGRRRLLHGKARDGSLMATPAA
jgi:hypothetical protein